MTRPDVNAAIRTGARIEISDEILKDDLVRYAQYLDAQLASHEASEGSDEAFLAIYRTPDSVQFHGAYSTLEKCQEGAGDQVPVFRQITDTPWSQVKYGAQILRVRIL